MKVVASSETTLSSTNDIFVGPNPPPHPMVGQIWLDTSVKPPVLRMWDGENWIVQEMDLEQLDPDFVEKIRDSNQIDYQEAMDFANALSERMKNESARLDGLFDNVEALSTRTNENSSQLSTIKQSYSGLESKVSNLEANTSSSITQLSGQINQRVMKGDLISQINLEAGSAYISSKAIVLDGDTTVLGAFYAPKVLSGSTVSGNAYTLIEGAYLKSRGYFSKTWLEGTRSGWHEVTIDKGHMKMKDTTNGGAVYYTARGISTQMDGDNDGQASGTIEFMSRKYLNSVNGLTISSSGRLALESTAGSRIYINPRGAGVHIADENDTYYDLYANNIFATRSLFINGWEAATKDYVRSQGYLTSVPSYYTQDGQTYVSASGNFRNSSSGSNTLIGTGGKVCMVGWSTTSAGNWQIAKGSSWENGSSYTYKQDIKEMNRPALPIIENLTICEYRLKNGVLEGKFNNWQMGLISEYSSPVASEDGLGINSYKMDSMMWKGIQELYQMVKGILYTQEMALVDLEEVKRIITELKGANTNE
ncbi:hypothetical protein [Rummeliibacillus stabekisii]|uniref:Peptidase S74 domain-containing protein n=1 Tax=Rummeliibacillus stabekisii TaxID=241244 RepID=A0A143H9R2_9BACL|nr:hypothetical protein [Rummeliibacillus stabekisii]AMW98458.1 hypothetical protein ATY39_02815 [Rummeliibacillus stabekisii]